MLFILIQLAIGVAGFLALCKAYSYWVIEKEEINPRYVAVAFIWLVASLLMAVIVRASDNLDNLGSRSLLLFALPPAMMVFIILMGSLDRRNRKKKRTQRYWGTQGH